MQLNVSYSKMLFNFDLYVVKLDMSNVALIRVKCYTMYYKTVSMLWCLSGNSKVFGSQLVVLVSFVVL